MYVVVLRVGYSSKVMVARPPVRIKGILNFHTAKRRLRGLSGILKP